MRNKVSRVACRAACVSVYTYKYIRFEHQVWRRLAPIRCTHLSQSAPYLPNRNGVIGIVYKYSIRADTNTQCNSCVRTIVLIESLKTFDETYTLLSLNARIYSHIWVCCPLANDKSYIFNQTTTIYPYLIALFGLHKPESRPTSWESHPAPHPDALLVRLREPNTTYSPRDVCRCVYGDCRSSSWFHRASSSMSCSVARVATFSAPPLLGRRRRISTIESLHCKRARSLYSNAYGRRLHCARLPSAQVDGSACRVEECGSNHARQTNVSWEPRRIAVRCLYAN